jgi:hypothetical protein
VVGGRQPHLELLQNLQNTPHKIQTRQHTSIQ